MLDKVEALFKYTYHQTNKLKKKKQLSSLPVYD